MHSQREIRAIPAGQVRMAMEPGRLPRIEGYAAVFNSRSEDLGGFVEEIEPGAFAGALRGAKVQLLINHEGLPLADTMTGTLELKEDAHGLFMRAELDPDDPDVQRILPKMKRGILNKMSFGFRMARDSGGRILGAEWDMKQNPPLRRLVDIADVFDVSVVTRPAYPDTSVAKRSLEDARADLEQAREADERARAEMENRRRRLEIEERAA